MPYDIHVVHSTGGLPKKILEDLPFNAPFRGQLLEGPVPESLRIALIRRRRKKAVGLLARKLIAAHSPRHKQTGLDVTTQPCIAPDAVHFNLCRRQARRPRHLVITQHQCHVVQACILEQQRHSLYNHTPIRIPHDHNTLTLRCTFFVANSDLLHISNNAPVVERCIIQHILASKCFIVTRQRENLAGLKQRGQGEVAGAIAEDIAVDAVDAVHTGAIASFDQREATGFTLWSVPIQKAKLLKEEQEDVGRCWCLLAVNAVVMRPETDTNFHVSAIWLVDFHSPMELG
mmetsp:Transcript_92403/g.206578  ORF Transcript_92403/g.206578 Transcript_92403/m.206578 type:complete len:288 (+) Transcript_92403:718-1581(+)